MNISTENLQFVLQNNPEYVIIEIIQELEKNRQEIEQLDYDSRYMKNAISQLDDKLKFFIWYTNQNPFRKLWWKLKKYSLADISNKFYKKPVI